MTKEKPTLALITTYEVDCGIATYAAYLEPHLSKHFDVTVFPLNPSYFTAGSGPSCKMADLEIDRICEELPDFDVVSIQFESALFGTNPSQVFQRVEKLIAASKKVIVTFHSFLYASNLPYSAFIKNPMAFLKSYRANQWATAFTKMLDTIKSIKEKHYHLIVHTPREANSLKSLYDIHHVTDYPYNQLSKEEIKEIKNNPARTALLKRFKLSEHDKLIGCFGFITRYKGIDTAIKALSNLPPEYKLLIFGSAHPNHIALHKSIDPYMNELVQLINDPKMNLTERVLFGGKSTNQEFTAAIHGCDFVVLPYLETGQTSSGPATMALELSKKIVATNNHFFNEVANYAPEAFLQFDIGNYTHLAQLIRNFPDDLTHQALDTYNQQYSIEKRATAYWQAYKKMAG